MLKNRNYILYLIVLFALTLRLYGINVEVPHPDDYITVQAAMHFGLTQVALTGFGLYGLYVWPAIPMVYIQIILFSIYFLFGWIVDIFPDIESFKNLYLTDPSSFYLIGRIMCVAFSAGTIWALYYLARRLYNHKVGLMASFFLSVCFIHSFHSQFIRPDVPSTFFIILTLIYCLAILEKGKLRNYIYAGIFTGLATATKFTSGILLAPIIVAHIMAERREGLDFKNGLRTNNFLSVGLIIFGTFFLIGSFSIGMFEIVKVLEQRISPDGVLNEETLSFLQFLVTGCKLLGFAIIVIGILSLISAVTRNFLMCIFASKKLLSSFAAILLSFIVFNPLFFLDFKEQLRIFITDPNFFGKNNLFIGVDGLGLVGNLWWYLKGPLNWGLGFYFEIMASLGLLLAILWKRKKDWIVLLFVFIYFMVIGFGKFKWERYAVTLMPFAALYSAAFLNFAADKILNQYIMPKRKNALLAISCVILILWPTYNIIRYDYLLTQKDTRIEVKEWIEKHIAAGSKIGQDAYTGDLPVDMYKLEKRFSLSNVSLDYYLDNGFDYLLVSNTQYNRYFAESQKYPDNVRFYHRLFSEYDLTKEFYPRKDLWPDPDERFSKYHIHISPTIRIYNLNSH